MSNHINHCLMFQASLVEVNGEKRPIHAHERFNHFLHQNPNVEVLHFYPTQEHLRTYIYCVIKGPKNLHFDKFSQAEGVDISYGPESEDNSSC